MVNPSSEEGPRPNDEDSEEPGSEERQGRPTQPVDLVRMGLWFYGGMAFLAVAWRAGWYGEPMFYTTLEAEDQGFALVDNIALGLFVGGIVVGISYVFTKQTSWGDRLARELARTIGPLSMPEALLMAAASGFAEELFFRGALQPRVGLVVAGVLFGAVHFVPRREMVAWTGFAIVMGLVFGWMFESTGNLVAPVVAHALVNAVNLPLLVRQYGGESDGAADEEPP